MSAKKLPAIAHVSIGINDVVQALAFYDAVLLTLGLRRLVELPAIGAAYGRDEPEFWVHLPYDERPASVGNGVHVAFRALDQAQVRAFHAAALAAGATDCGAPGLRPHYAASYYGCFVHDPEGNKIEAMCLAPQ